MYGYKTNTDWKRNKNSESVIYSDAHGVITEITLADFLAESLMNTAELFHKIKELSDKQFEDEDVDERRLSKNEFPLFDWYDFLISEASEIEQINGTLHDDGQAYQNRRNKMLSLIPDVLGMLTENQRRRFLLHKVDGISTRQIAEMENISHQSVCECLIGAEKKIKKYLKKSGYNA